MAELSRLPATVESLWEWQYSGACRNADPTLFFHPDSERGPARERRDAAAVAVCARCPVIDACREHGRSVQERYGVWGGLTEDDRLREQSDLDLARCAQLPCAPRVTRVM